MPDTPLSKKLLIKPGYKLLVLNAPDGYLEMLNPLPDGTEVESKSGYSGAQIRRLAVAYLS